MRREAARHDGAVSGRVPGDRRTRRRAPSFWRRLFSGGAAVRPARPAYGRDDSLQASHEGRYGDAEKLLLVALRQIDRPGADPLRLAATLNDLADVYRVQAKYTEAEPLYRRAIALEEGDLGTDHPALARALNNLALLYRAQGLYDLAEPLCRRALAITEHAYGSDHPSVAAALGNLLAVCLAQGRYVEAGPLFRRSVAVKERLLGPRHPGLAASMSTYAAFLRKTQREAEAADWEARAHEIRAAAGDG